jgi:hypothetical protein
VKTELQKDKTILRLLDRLAKRLGTRAFDVVDHWEADLCAIGIARPDDHRVLVYVCTYEQQDGTYFVSLELPPAAGSDLPFSSAGEQEAKSFDELVEIIQRHLSYA